MPNGSRKSLCLMVWWLMVWWLAWKNFTRLQNSSFYSVVLSVLQDESFHWILNFAILLMANLLNLNSAYYHIFRNLSMMAYMIEIQESKFVNIKFFDFDLIWARWPILTPFIFNPVGYLSITCIKFQY